MATEGQLVQLALFLAACFASGRIADLVHVSPIIAYIAIGAVLGPPLANFAPVADGLALAGLLGIQLAVVEAGLSTKLADVKRCATRAIIVAVLGVIFPIAGAILILCVHDVLRNEFRVSSSLKTAFAVGSAIAPTSLGVTATLLAHVGELDTELGRLISIAAVFDDVISLILLSQVNVISSDNATAWRMSQPVLFSALFIVGAILIATFLPVVFEAILRKIAIPQRLRASVGLSLIVAMAIAMTYIATKAGTSFLLAGYLTGVAFAAAQDDMTRAPWAAHVSVFTTWLTTLFFAATIAFVIPLRSLFSASALGLGALLAVASIAGKLVCGIGMLPNVVDGFAVAVAMLGRGEFGFLIAAQARASGLLNERVYAATTWGVVVPTLLTPLLFNSVFNFRRKRIERINDQERDVAGGELDVSGEPEAVEKTDKERQP